MGFVDFVVKYDPEKDSIQDVSERIIYSIIVSRLKQKKPVVMFISGDSGEGKSISAIALQDVIMRIQGHDLKDYLDAINVYTPLQYPQKLEKLLFDKEYKKANIICMHEAREVVKAKLWHSFLNQSISDVNAMSRSVKRLCIMVISQFIRDISSDIRYTINYYCKVSRPKNKPARMYIYMMWKDDRDLEKPKLRKRKLCGYLVYPNGRYRKYIPEYLELKLPRKELIDIFEQKDTEAKKSIIKQKINKLMQEMQKETGFAENKKIAAMVEWYSKNTETLQSIGKTYRGKWKLKPEAMKMHDLNKDEAKELEKRLNEKFKEGGIIGT